MKTIFDCEPSGLRKNLPPHIKAPLPIASERSKELLSDLQKREAIVFCGRFFDDNGNQMQDMQVAPDPLPAAALMVNAMNTNAALSDFLRQGDIPRHLNQELKNLKPTQKGDDGRSTVDLSSFMRIEPRQPRDPLTPAYDSNIYAPNLGPSAVKSARKRVTILRPHHSFLPRNCFPC
jgi:hypothetical protein